MPTNLEYARITMDTYKTDGDNSAREGAGRFKLLGNGLETSDGLSIQAYVDENTKEIIIGVTGTNGLNDAKTFSAIVAGGYPDQFRDALKYADNIRSTYEKEGYSISVTGHSLGGTISQMLANTFNWDGVTFDAPAASGIIESDEYQAHAKSLVKSLGLSSPPGPGDLINFTEQGSLVSSVPGRDYVGSETSLNLVGDGLLGASLLAGGPVGVAAFAFDQWISDNAQHSAEKYVNYFGTDQSITNIDGYQYVGGSYDTWYDTPPNSAIGRFDWSGPASPEKTAELDLEKEQRIEHNLEIKQTESNNAEPTIDKKSGPGIHRISFEDNQMDNSKVENEPEPESVPFTP